MSLSTLPNCFKALTANATFPCVSDITAILIESITSYFRKIAIEDFAILQTGDLAAILRCRRIFALHRIGYIRLVAKMASASSGRQLTSFPKNQCLFSGCMYYKN